MNFSELILKSLTKRKEVSSSRILAYAMMIIIITFGLTAIAIELINAINAWSAGKEYVIPTEHIVILGMWLAHQLALLGIYKNSEKHLPVEPPMEIYNEPSADSAEA
jgi:phosphate starvation-inducible membrane PsiE